ncbi:hypothetical protein BDZ94DRAFT_1271552, partial [Collybia nuda]
MYITSCLFLYSLLSLLDLHMYTTPNPCINYCIDYISTITVGICLLYNPTTHDFHSLLYEFLTLGENTCFITKHKVNSYTLKHLGVLTLALLTNSPIA